MRLAVLSWDPPRRFEQLELTREARIAFSAAEFERDSGALSFSHTRTQRDLVPVKCPSHRSHVRRVIRFRLFSPRIPEAGRLGNISSGGKGIASVLPGLVREFRSTPM
jgi:hypothetical protein